MRAVANGFDEGSIRDLRKAIEGSRHSTVYSPRYGQQRKDSLQWLEAFPKLSRPGDDISKLLQPSGDELMQDE